MPQIRNLKIYFLIFATMVSKKMQNMAIYIKIYRKFADRDLNLIPESSIEMAKIKKVEMERPRAPQLIAV